MYMTAMISRSLVSFSVVQICELSCVQLNCKHATNSLFKALNSYSIKPMFFRKMCFVTVNTQMFLIHTEPTPDTLSQIFNEQFLYFFFIPLG